MADKVSMEGWVEATPTTSLVRYGFQLWFFVVASPLHQTETGAWKRERENRARTSKMIFVWCCVQLPPLARGRSHSSVEKVEFRVREAVRASRPCRSHNPIHCLFCFCFVGGHSFMWTQPCIEGLLIAESSAPLLIVSQIIVAMRYSKDQKLPVRGKRGREQSVRAEFCELRGAQ
mmetsp:Transcript_38/g.92  ORF Transcript_38/g.92 Transcript_38/m.92 type:complete len:175 (-) Transcript_38:1539-2063(-)